MFERKITGTSPRKQWDATPKRKDPKDMTEEEKHEWKIRVFKECREIDARIDKNLKSLEEDKRAIRETVQATHSLISNYQCEVDKISKKALELLAPELEKREQALKTSVGQVLCTEGRAIMRRPKIKAVIVEETAQSPPRYLNQINNQNQMLNVASIKAKTSLNINRNFSSNRSTDRSVETSCSSSRQSNHSMNRSGNFFTERKSS